MLAACETSRLVLDEAPRNSKRGRPYVENITTTVKRAYAYSTAKKQNCRSKQGTVFRG